MPPTQMMLRKRHFIRGWEVQSLSAHSPHLSSYSSRLCLGYFVDKEQNYDVTKFSQENLWHPGIHWEWLLFSLPTSKKPHHPMWDPWGWPDTPSDNLQFLELPWQCCSSYPAHFSLPDSQIASGFLSLCICSSIQLPAAAHVPGNCWPWSQKAHTIIKRGAAYSAHLALSMRNRKARGWSTLSDFFLESSSIHKDTQPRAMTQWTQQGQLWGCACGEGLASVILLRYFSLSKVNLTLSFISSAHFVHIM